jgi:hypothetical protein
MGELVNDFINKYSHIITNNISCYNIIEQEILLSKQVSTMIIDKEWKYWHLENHFPHFIQQHVFVKSNNN